MNIVDSYMDICGPCSTDPDTHSFSILTKEGTHNVYYSSFHKLKDYMNSTAILNHMRIALIPNKGNKWIWVLNCQHFGVKHAAQMACFVNVVNNIPADYSETLLNVYILNGGPIIQGTLKTLLHFFSPEYVSKIRYLKGSRIEVLSQLEKVGWAVSDAYPILQYVA
jgi:CRAL/TRIO domain